MAIVTGTGSFGVDMCTILGLESKMVKSIHISIKANDVVMVYTTMYLESDEAEKVKAVFKKYELHEKVDYDALVVQWHDPQTITDLPLHEYLGMTKKQYGHWIKTGKIS